MADKKISQLTAASTPLAGTEVLPIVQSGSTVKVSVANLTAGRSVSATDISAGLGAVGTPAYTFTGDLNTGMWSPAADTLAFSQGGVESVRILPTGDFGIGTSTPGVKLDVAGNSTGFYAGGAIAIRDANAPGNSVLLGQASHIFGGGGSTNAALINNGAGYFAFGTASTERMQITAAGNITATTGNFVLGTAGKGIDFSANAHAPGMTSELLNWYEEGNWTPTQGAGLTVVGTYSSFGKYTRIGKQVTIVGEIVGSTSVAVSSGGVLCAGLPFATPGGTAAVFAGGLSNANVDATSLVIGSGTTLYASSAIAATTRLYFSATYLTA